MPPNLASYLSWEEIAPSRRPPLDLDAIEPGVHALVAGGRGRDEDERVDSIDRWLVSTYGPWIAGWHWSAEEWGGPVRTWTENGETLYREGEDDRAATARVLASIAEWQGFLVDLEALFAGLPAGDGPWLAPDIEVAAASLVPVIAERTGAEDAWYQTLAKALTWYAESRGHDAAVVEPTIRDVIGGRYRSWVAPDPTETSGVAAELSARLLLTKPRAVDATERWRNLRPDRSMTNARARDVLRTDGHRHFIATRDRARDADRADAMDVALDACREAAAANQPLGFALLASWQAIVLGGAAPFRTTDAFAKNGRERYPYAHDLEDEFAGCLEDANDPNIPVETRAARAYLDVCFFHPFEDGNARAARLALDFVLAREGLGLHAVEPLFVISRSATDDRGLWNFSRLLEHLVGPFTPP